MSSDAYLENFLAEFRPALKKREQRQLFDLLIAEHEQLIGRVPEEALEGWLDYLLSDWLSKNKII